MMSTNFDLIEYMNQGVKGIVENALKASLKNPREAAFLVKFLNASKKAETRRIQMERSGNHIPPFLIASIATKCNLFCKGCYARANQLCHDNAEDGQLASHEWHRIFEEASSIGVSFVLLAGGEPLMRRDVIQCAG
ncbi:MAG: 4Fe-4S cluster-binding domain-containing protein, partial [Bacillota bacterium]